MNIVPFSAQTSYIIFVLFILNVYKFIECEMGRYKAGMLLLWVFFALCTLEFKVEAKASSPLEREIEAKLKLLNKPAVKSIRSKDGDIIDCVNIYKQLALDHPALKNHIIQVRY
ncbi:putative neprosin activation peptide [Medicago truncatula]|uniref:Putative neprosin activation peptide n=1 Tax=Medicago truncatula TaxID=3880 RepID=A0A396J5B1_MEDTR|nr:putative neprosin activation peptide [Medicago truncatula]